MNLDAVAQDVLATWRLENNPVVVSLSGSVKVAKTIEQIVSGLDSKTQDKASDVKLLSKDYNDLSKTFRYKATTGDDTYTVVIRAVPANKDERRMDEVSDVLVSCSCRHWRYGGCEYHAYQGNYLYQPKTPRGTLEAPAVKDPEGNNYVCKHAYAALEKVKSLYIDKKSY